jgi:hypothetical protein
MCTATTGLQGVKYRPTGRDDKIALRLPDDVNAEIETERTDVSLLCVGM